MLILAPSPTRYPKMCLQCPLSAATCRGVHWQRKSKKNLIDLSAQSVTLHAGISDGGYAVALSTQIQMW